MIRDHPLSILDTNLIQQAIVVRRETLDPLLKAEYRTSDLQDGERVGKVM